MSRRSTPERIDEARRAATRNRLIGEGAAVASSLPATPSSASFVGR